MSKHTSIVQFLKATIEVIPQIILLAIIISWFTIIPGPTESSQVFIWLIAPAVATVSSIVVLVYYGNNPTSNRFTLFSHTTLSNRKLALARVAFCGSAVVFETVYALLWACFTLITNPTFDVVSPDGDILWGFILVDAFWIFLLGLILLVGVMPVCAVVEVVYEAFKKENMRLDETELISREEEEGRSSCEV